MDCQYSSCYLLVQPLVTSLATSYVLKAGLGPASGCEEPCLADLSVVSFPSIPMCPGTHTSWILLCSASFTRDWWQCQINLEFIWKLSRALMVAWLLERMCNVPTCSALFVFYIMQTLMVYISAWITVVWSPKLKLCSLLKPHLYTPTPVPLLVCVPDEALFDIQFNPVLLLILVRELDREWLVVCISRGHHVSPRL